MEHSEHYPHVSHDAERMRRARNPELYLEDLTDLAAREDMPLMRYLQIYHGDLTAEQTAILWLHVEGGMSKQEIADALGITRQSTQERFDLIQRKLADALEEDS
ncbi:MAG TPA: hypothetical protein DGT21_01770 [Armatimonadetes bacterium]|jgi:DNA-directed RNA polymerase specialized sigma24 family protein|nr:hypothetical protein [Armatimonadota bacterium]